MYSLLNLIDTIVDLYCFTLIAYVAVTWLVTFNIINPWQPLTRSIVTGLSRLHDPILDWIRSISPSLGGLDISPIILLLAIQFARNLLLQLIT